MFYRKISRLFNLKCFFLTPTIIRTTNSIAQPIKTVENERCPKNIFPLNQICSMPKSYFTLAIAKPQNYAEILKLLVNSFLKEEPLTKALHVKDDTSTKDYFLNMWSKYLKEDLVTDKDFLGCGIGTTLVESSINFARTVGYKLVRMDCTSEFSAKIARKVGMKLAWEMPYEQIVGINGKPIIKIESPHLFMRTFIKEIE